MAHMYPSRPNNPNSNDNTSGIPEFIPIPADLNPAPPSEAAPSANITVNAEPNVPATDSTDAYTSYEEPATAPAVDKASRSKRGRPPKNTDVKPEKASRKRSVEKEVTTIHFTTATLQRLRVMHALNKVSISDIVSECCDDMLNRTYQCHNPSCNCKFTICSTEEDAAPKPACCPVCGSDRPRQLKSGY